jgi:two-component system sensor histidine kinase VicK
VADSFAARLRERDVALAIEAGEIPRVEVDGDKLAQVLVNLLANALRYSPAGGTITVSLRPATNQKSAGVMTGPADGVRIAVADEGPGIPKADLSAIWERFHKVDPARPRTEPGAGLGLAIVKEIIDQHGGKVFAANREHGGAEVGFWLPAPP